MCFYLWTSRIHTIREKVNENDSTSLFLTISFFFFWFIIKILKYIFQISSKTWLETLSNVRIWRLSALVENIYIYISLLIPNIERTMMETLVAEYFFEKNNYVSCCRIFKKNLLDTFTPISAHNIVHVNSLEMNFEYIKYFEKWANFISRIIIYFMYYIFNMNIYK